jgi:hypothetical protein
MLSVDLAAEITNQIAEHDESSSAHDVRAFVALYVTNADDTLYVPESGKKIVLRKEGDHDPTDELNQYDIVGDGNTP